MMGLKKRMGVVLCCALLCGCGQSQPDTQTILDGYTQMSGATMEGDVICNGDNLISEFTLRCDYLAEGETVVEVLAPDTMAGVQGVLSQGEWVLKYEDVVFNVGALSSQAVSPLACMPLLMEGLRQGWLLEEGEESYGDTPCLRVAMDYSDTTLADVVVTVWLSLEEGTPVAGEVSVVGERILQVGFTSFAFCDILEAE